MYSTLFFSVVFIFKLSFESFKEFGGASFLLQLLYRKCMEWAKLCYIFPFQLHMHQHDALCGFTYLLCMLCFANHMSHIAKIKNEKISFHLTLINVLPQVMSFSLQCVIILIKAKPSVTFALILCFWVLNNLIMKMVHLFTWICNPYITKHVIQFGMNLMTIKYS